MRPRRFRYRGVDDQGRDLQGGVEGVTLAAAAREVRERGVLLHHLEADDEAEATPPLGDIDAYSHFNRSLAALGRIGIPLSDGMRQISRGLRWGAYRRRVRAVESALRDGRSLDEAVAVAGDFFPPCYAEMVRAGIVSGNLPAVLQAAARTHEGLRRARRAAISAFSYPGLSLALGLACVFVIILPFLRGLEGTYRTYVTDPSWLVDGFLRISRNPGLPGFVLLGMAAAIFAGVQILRYTAPGEAVLHRLPLAGPVLRTIVMSRFLGTLAILLRAGVPVEDGVSLAVGASGSRRLMRHRDRMMARARDGERISEVLGGTIPQAGGMPAYLRLAEERGDLPEACGEVADLLADQSAARSDSLFLLLFPASLLLTGILLAPAFIAVVSTYLELLGEVAR